MTQYKLIIDWVHEFGSILPAKMSGKTYQDTMFGSETSKRCRELRKSGVLRSEKDGRFERFYSTYVPIINSYVMTPINANKATKNENPRGSQVLQVALFS